ncbi:MAG TPA: hypothetical protein VF933_09840 [Streptosporangiaceae bacterium]
MSGRTATAESGRRTRWHRQVNAEKDLVNRLGAAVDYLRAVARQTPTGAARREVQAAITAVMKAADKIEGMNRDGHTE